MWTLLALAILSGLTGEAQSTCTTNSTPSPPVICSVENSATGGVRDSVHAATGNSFISVYVAGLGVPDSVGSLFPKTDYQGVEVFFDTTQLPLYNVMPSVNLINTMLPSNAESAGLGTITVKTANGTSQPFTIELAPSDVGIFRYTVPANPNQGVVLLANTYWFAMSGSFAPSYNLPSPCSGLLPSTPCAQPVHPNDEIVIYFTGGGLATPNGNPNGQPVPTNGSVAPANGSVLYQTVIQPTVTIGGQAAVVKYSGIAPGTAAEYQINAIVPSAAAGSQIPLMVSFGNSSDTVMIAVSNP